MLLVGIAYKNISKVLKLLKHGETINGKIVDIQKIKKEIYRLPKQIIRHYQYVYIVEAEFTYDKKIYRTYGNYSYRTSPKIGQVVPIVFDKNSPKKSVIKTFKEIFAFEIEIFLMLFFGGGWLFFIHPYFVFRDIKKSYRKTLLEFNGTLIKGNIIETKEGKYKILAGYELLVTLEFPILKNEQNKRIISIMQPREITPKIKTYLDANSQIDVLINLEDYSNNKLIFPFS